MAEETLKTGERIGPPLWMVSIAVDDIERDLRAPDADVYRWTDKLTLQRFLNRLRRYEEGSEILVTESNIKLLEHYMPE